MNIMILVGSSDSNSHSLNLGKALQEKLQSMDQDVNLIDLVATDLPVYRLDDERSGNLTDDTAAFLQQSKDADAFVWITPIYHNSYSGILKNALDWQHSVDSSGKVVGLCSNGGQRSAQAVDSLMMVARSLNTVAIPTRVCTHPTDFDDNKTITAPDIKDRINRFCEELVGVTEKLAK